MYKCDKCGGTGQVASKAPTKMSAKEFIGYLQDGIYKHRDVFREAQKCFAWCKVNGKQYSNKRLLNWLNRHDSYGSMELTGTHISLAKHVPALVADNRPLIRTEEEQEALKRNIAEAKKALKW